MKTIEDSIAAAAAFFEESGVDPGPNGIAALAEFLRGCHDGVIDKAAAEITRLDREAMAIKEPGIEAGEALEALTALKVGL